MLALHEELSQEVVLTDEVILTLLAPLEAAMIEWYKVQAPKVLKGRLSDEDFYVSAGSGRAEGVVGGGKGAERTFM
jgi:hypothetical protein